MASEDGNGRSRQLGLQPASVAASFEVPGQLVEAIAARVAELVTAASPEPVSPWLDVDGACAYLGFSRNTLYRLTAARAIPCRKKANGQGLRFRRDELDEWMDEQYPRLDRLA
jgi:excisionase family DNA binding protein